MISDYYLVTSWLKFVFDNPSPAYSGDSAADHVVAFLLSDDENFVRVVPAARREDGVDISNPTLCPAALNPVTWAPGSNADARRFKKRFQSYHRRRDWFRCEGELRGWLRRQVQRHGGWTTTNLYERAEDLKRLLGKTPDRDDHWKFSRRDFFPHRSKLEAASPHLPWVYFLLARECRRVKIGTSESLFERFEKLQDVSPCRLEFLGTAEGGRGVETRIHGALRQFRAHGEWFDWNPTIERAVTQIMRDGTIPQLAVDRLMDSG